MKEKNLFFFNIKYLDEGKQLELLIIIYWNVRAVDFDGVEVIF